MPDKKHSIKTIVTSTGLSGEKQYEVTDKQEFETKEELLEALKDWTYMVIGSRITRALTEDPKEVAREAQDELNKIKEDLSLRGT